MRHSRPKSGLAEQDEEATFLADQIRVYKTTLAKVDFIEEAEVLKLINKLQTEASGANVKKTLKLIEIVRAKIELLNNMLNLEKLLKNLELEQLDDLHILFARGDEAKILIDARVEYRAALSNTIAKLKTMTHQLLQSPSASIPINNIKLITDIAKNIYDFSTDFRNEDYMNKLIDNTKHILKKSGKFWQAIKTALTTILGLGCIIVGVLGLAPSFGVSATLVTVGGLLCASSHLPGFLNTTSHLKRKTADEVATETRNLLNQTKKLLSIKVSEQQEESFTPDNYPPYYHF